MCGSRSDYLEYHESDFDLKMADVWDNLPDECKHCEQLGFFNSCKLKADDEEECPLENLMCEDCQYYCTIVNREGETLDYGFCSEEETYLEDHNRACQHFTKYEGSNK